MGLSDIAFRINWVDALILILLFRISYVGLNGGLASEVIRFIGIFTSFIIALHYYLSVGNFIASHTPISSGYASLITFIGLIFIIKYIFRIIESYIMGKVITIHIASIYNTIGGLIIGVMRGILLVSIVVMALSITPIEYINHSATKNSVLGNKFLNIGRGVYYKTSRFLRLKYKQVGI